MNGVALNLTQEEAGNLLALINRAQITGGEALPVVLLKQKIELAIKSYAEIAMASEKNGAKPVAAAPA